jgi:hypothetical protein
MFSGFGWAFEVMRDFRTVAETLGIGLGVLAAIITAGVLFAPTRRLAIELAIVVVIALAAYGRGVHDGDVAVRVEWADADARAATAKMQLEQDAATAADTDVRARLEQLETENKGLADKVANYEKRDPSKGGDVCVIGDRADRLRDVAGESGGQPAAANKNPVVRKGWRSRFPALHRPGT